MYACSNAELRELLDSETSFPAGQFGADSSLLAALRQLGLQPRLTPAAMTDIARGIERLSTADATSARAR